MPHRADTDAVTDAVGPRVAASVGGDHDRPETDEALMEAVSRGDTTAFGELANRHGIRYRALAFRFLGDMAAAEDCVQDAFLSLWQKPDRFDPSKARFTTWFHRVVVNRALDAKRKRRPQSLPDGFDVEDERATADRGLENDQQWQLVLSAIDQLSDRQTTAIRLTYLDGLPNSEAAKVMDLSLKAFESLLHRARTALKEKLGVKE